MLCKGTMNFTRGKKKWRETAGAASRHVPGFFGGGHRAKPIQCTTTLAAVKKKISGFRFYERLLIFLLGGDRTDFDGIAVQNTGYRGVLAGLLVERGQHGLVSRI